eukprot:CAMPEP_0202714058 /NCGR_PEP_ID=MMETSP1385-20130828/62305_1 /ASSEMBLY_ACC=CAM_ASM_000861 /TAXON_ID=933848 /ORGANISM="Elphidium margaritaceum" /LENGTH=379 /DNA_ID=CAMNT_0049374625 /DNA_START=30 /DNA_END=1169 /DNA_ORIENTATION=+
MSYKSVNVSIPPRPRSRRALSFKTKKRKSERVSVAAKKKGKKHRRTQSANVFLQDGAAGARLPRLRKVERKLGPLDIGRIKYAEGSNYEDTEYDFLAEKIHKHSRASSFRQRKRANPVEKRPSVKDIGTPNFWQLPSFYDLEEEKIRNESHLSFLNDSKPIHVVQKKKRTSKGTSNRSGRARPNVEYLTQFDAEHKYDVGDDFYLMTPCLGALYESSNESEISGLSDFADSVEDDLDRQMTEALDEILRASSASPPNSNLADVQKMDDATLMNINMYVNSDELNELISMDEQVTAALDDILSDKNCSADTQGLAVADEEIEDALYEVLAASPSPMPSVAMCHASDDDSDIKKIDRKQLLVTVQSNLQNIQCNSPRPQST